MRRPSETALLQNKNDDVKPCSSTKVGHFPGPEAENDVHDSSHRFQGLVSSCSAGPNRPSFFNPSVSLPRLVDMDWRVDIKTSSDSISRMAVPTCLLQLKVMSMAVKDTGSK